MANTEPHVDSAGGSGEVMDRWKTDNCESGGDRLSSRSTSLSRRLIGLAGVAALTVGGAGAVLLGGGAAFATTPTSYTNNFTVGTTSVGGVTFSAANLGQSNTTTYTVGFTIPSTEPAGSFVVTLSGMPDAATTGSFSTTLTDVTAGVSYGVLSSSDGFTATAAGSGTLTVPAGDYTAGDTMSVQIVGLENALTTGNPYTPSVAIPGYLSGSAAAVNLTGATVTPTLTASSAVPGAGGVTYTYASATGLGTAPAAIYVDLSAPSSSTPAVFPSASSNYTVTDTTTGTTVPLATTTPITVTAGVAGTSPTSVKIALGTNTIANTDLISVVVSGVVNPSPAATYYGSVTAAAQSTNATNGESVGIGTSLTSATLAVSPATQGSSSAVYGVSFKVPANDTNISGETVTSTFTDSSNNTIATSGNWAIFDATNSAGDSAASTGTPTFNSSVAAGDSVTVDYYGETNTSASSVSASVYTSHYSVAVTTNAVSLALPSTTNVYPTVSLGSATAGAVTTYTLGDFVVPTGGLTAASSIVVEVGTGTGGTGANFTANTGFTFPANSVNYTLTDLTNSAASGATETASTDGFTLKNTNALAAGDKIQITVTGVTNSSTSGTSYLFQVVSLASGTTATAAPTAPTAATTYPNGALVQSGGNQIDVIAGGVGFGIPSMSVYDLIAASDSSAVVAGSFPTATTVRTGTVLKVVGSPAIYVVGTNGDAYAFSTPTEFTSDGYSAKSVVSVPSLGSLTIGSGAAPTAAVTMPDGALVQSGTTIYVYAGGKAFGIPTWSEYQTIAAVTGSSVVQGTVSNTSATSLTAGTLIQPIGSFGIWVSDGSSIYQFSTASQFASDGYNGANVVPVPNATGLTQA